ncbi:molybdopterin converting factor subunit 1 [Lutimonas saemankumensis]|uniref:molybdopterin converting factor subunit 1 n=1 Tax=Lutimonas saemankumensis TaxID=483016 RepID=UPI001CD5F9F1|nr:molybdopterin converting factor subunit 1 [Lutimonas saemankumensis]MCA0932835.1 molybdopterin converting factor subunit 1 [Lutimonas saemankumensis]
MEIKILFFGISKDLAGTNSTNFQIEKDISVKDVRELLLRNYPSFSSMDTFSIAVNESYAEDDTQINNNDIIAVIPPVSGG